MSALVFSEDEQRFVVKVHIFPGQFVKMFLTEPGLDKPSPVFATVMAVHRGAITITDGDSPNGLAKIVCHMNSQDGTYFYEYPGITKKVDVKRLEDAQGNEIRVKECFIEDE